MDLDRLPPLSPINFFAVRADCWYFKPGKKSILTSKYILPSTSDLCQEDHFANVAIAWNEEGIRVAVEMKKRFQGSSYPVITDGDAVELFFDTRDVKTAGFNTRFCHYFYFFPKETEGRLAEEITHFRTDDRHDLCDPDDLDVQASFATKKYSMQITIPAHCLVGYDPNQFDRLGFNYRISSVGSNPQHFSACSDEFPIEQRPALWSSLQLKR